MKDIMLEILAAVITVVLPILTPYIIKLIKNIAEKFNTEISAKYAQEIANAVSDAVAATSQTYVDTLKATGEFKDNTELHTVAAEKALTACIASLSPKCREFINNAYDDISLYIMNKIEAEVRTQKLGK